MTQSTAKQQNIISSLYAVLLVVTIGSFVPYMGIAGICSIMFVVVFIALYVYRARAVEDDLLHNHTTYLIRSIWISSLLMIIGFPIFYVMGDHFVIEQMYQNVAAGHSIPTQNDLHLLSAQYMKDNVSAAIISFAPCVLYFLYRLLRGTERAIKGYRILNPRGWL